MIITLTVKLKVKIDEKFYGLKSLGQTFEDKKVLHIYQIQYSKGLEGEGINMIINSDICVEATKKQLYSS